MDTGIGGNMQKRTLGKNLPEVECLTCWNNVKFDVSGIERLGDTDSWNVLLTCPFCTISMTFQFSGFAFYDSLLKHLKN